MAGYGDLILPGGQSYSNVILVIDSLSYRISFPGLLPGYVTTAGSIFTFYKFYHSAQKFPVFNVSFENTGAVAYNDQGNIIFSDETETQLIELNKNEEPVVSSNTSDILSPDFTLYPNPAHQHIMISGIESGTFAIHNARGKLIQTNSFSSQTPIDISEFTPGIYIMNIWNRDVFMGSKPFVIK